MSSFDDYSESDAETTFDDDASVCSFVSLSFERIETFRVLTPDDVVSQMDKELRNISEFVNMPSTISRILMDRYDWQPHSLMEKFLASEHDRESFFRDARIMNPRYYKDPKQRGTVAECLICYDTSEITGVQCGHKFCGDCWSTYLTTKIVDDGVQTIPCPDTKCRIIVEDATVKRLVKDPDVLVKYNRLICNSFVKCKKNLYYCKSPGCIYVLDIFDCTNTYVTCKCGIQFCFECYEEIHAPISCQLLKRWKSDDSATESYLSANTKACPNCHADIEKNGGCPHMSCRNCKHQFCWKCLGPWLKHDASYKCNAAEDDLKIRQNRTKMERMKYCWNRYSYNQVALKDEIQRFDIIWEQFEHRLTLKSALNEIFRCRRFLMYSYAFVYYLKQNNQVYILEAALDNIEAKIDHVSVTLENYIRMKENDEGDFAQKEALVRETVVDSAAHCEHLRGKWLHETEEGHTANKWEYRDD